jgi:hypothetical protein
MKGLILPNFDAALNDPEAIPEVLQTSPPVKKSHQNKDRKELNPVLYQLVETLKSNFNNYFSNQYKVTSMLPGELFSDLEANIIAENIDNINHAQTIGELIGGESIDGQFEMLHICVLNFRAGTEYKSYLNAQRVHHEEIVKEAERIHGIPEAMKKAKALARAKLRGPIEEAVNLRKRARKEKRIEKKEKMEREKEQKRLKWEQDRVYLEERKKFHSSNAGPNE